MRYKIKRLGLYRILTLSIVLLTIQARAHKDYTLSESAKFSILTCSPGPDLYSLFGHSAIRFQDNLNGRIIDWVYNYGTFEFDETFYWRFSMGKLDYLLSKEDFPYFQQGYILEGRGITEQELLLTSEQKRRLLNLLEENYLPQNRTYRYDFFYDNCSTRIRDILNKALDNKIEFKYQYKREYTFRQAIQTYLNYQPWSDFGIDLALGMPCDRTVDVTQMMFLPDSLLKEFDNAKYGAQPVVLTTQELIPTDYELSITTFLTPVVVFFAFLVLHIVFGFIFIRKGKPFQITDRLLFFVTGMIGVVVVFLWFFTDHTATRWNLNILWANPINLIIAFTTYRNLSGWKKKYLTFYFILLTLTLLTWFILPQRMHLSVISIVVALIFTCIKILRPQIFSSANSRQHAS